MRASRPLGRPPLDPAQPSTSVSVSLPMAQFDAFCVRAHYEGVSVPEIIRRDLRTAQRWFTSTEPGRPVPAESYRVERRRRVTCASARAHHCVTRWRSAGYCGKPSSPRLGCVTRPRLLPRGRRWRHVHRRRRVDMRGRDGAGHVRRRRHPAALRWPGSGGLEVAAATQGSTRGSAGGHPSSLR